MRLSLQRWTRSILPLLAATLLATAASAQQQVRAVSPDGRVEVAIQTNEGNVLYSVSRDGSAVLLPSPLGFEFRTGPPLRDNLQITDSARSSVDETWTQPWGEVAEVRDRHEQLTVSIAETTPPNRRFDVVFRVFDEGVAFRYVLPEQPALGSFEIMEELTQFVLVDEARAWFIPANDWNRYELLYGSSPASMLPTVHTPLTLEMQDGLHIVIHEAHLVDYAAMNLSGNRNRTLSVSLAPWADSVKVRGATPFQTPWRTIELADRAADLQPTVMALNLNPPNALADVSWIEPMKYVGIWWGMHIGTMTWHSGPLHGATTANAKQYIDFAAMNDMSGVLMEGWNIGWDGNWMENADEFSFTQSYPDLDLEQVSAYARERGVEIIGHHETSMGVENYERQLEDAFELYRSLGIRAVKTGYVGDRTKDGHAHHGQYMVRHWHRVIETAARYGIMLNVHEPIKDTGERRTYPNMLTREGARGQEYNAWGGEGGNPPEHETILFFTRMHSGPMDFTPGIFDLQIESANGTPRGRDEARVRTTLAKQLALYVVLFSPLHMAADLPENYDGQPAFRFIRDVPVNWETTQVVDARIGDFVIVARQERDGRDWYLGAITDEEARTFEVPLTFLPAGERFVAEIYADGPEAHWLHQPHAIAIDEQTVDAATTLTLRLAPGGGQAIRFRALQQPAPGRSDQPPVSAR